MHKFKKGQLVEILTDNPFIKEVLAAKNITVVGTILNCRYKTGVYFVYSPNNPFGGPGTHWYESKDLKPLVA